MAGGGFGGVLLRRNGHETSGAKLGVRYGEGSGEGAETGEGGQRERERDG
jgi:hypothetical protein